MFCRAGKIVDIFIPKDEKNGKNKGFAFIWFATSREADQAVEIATRRSWGGKKLQVNMARFKSELSQKSRRTWKETLLLERPKSIEASSSGGSKNRDIRLEANSYLWKIGWEVCWTHLSSQGRSSPLVAGWVVNDGEERGVRVAPWVVKKEKQSLYCRLIGFLLDEEALVQAESWLEHVWGKISVNIQLLDFKEAWFLHHLHIRFTHTHA